MRWGLKIKYHLFKNTVISIMFTAIESLLSILSNIAP